MASQGTTGIVVSYQHTQHGLRLLELPSEILDILDTAGSPALCLKTGEPGPELVLCTPDRTYDLKQVSSSNTLMLLSPYRENSEGLLPVGLMAGASFSGMLEILPVDITSRAFRSPTQLLADILLVYSQETDGPTPVVANAHSREHVWDSVPASDAELRKAWTELSAFEFGGLCFRPDAKTCTALWASLIRSDVDLMRQFSLQAFIDVGADFPAPFIASVLERLGSVGTEGTVRLDSSKAASALGGWLMQQYVEESRSDVPTLLEDWRSLLPGQWQSAATATMLESLPDYHLLGASRPDVPRVSVANSTQGAKRKSGTTRNWHDRFRKTKG